MNTPFDLEERLRETFDDIVPQLIVRARATQEVSLIGESAPPRPAVAGTPRRWSLLGAAAVVAVLAGVVWAVSRPGESATGPTPATATVDVPAGAPAWYAELRPWVPERFRHLALVDLSPDAATFEAIDPNNVVLWRIEVYTVEGGDGTAQVRLTCDDGRTNLGGATDPCVDGPAPATEDEVLALVDTMPAELLLARATGDAPQHLDRAAITRAIAAELNGESELASDLSTGSASLLYGTDGVPDTQVHVVSGIWPISFGGGGSAWAMSNIYAVRVTMADDSREAERTLLAYKVLIAAQGQSTTNLAGAQLEWYTILRQAVPARFTNMGITRIEPHLARFVAVDLVEGEVLDLIVRDVPGPAVEVTCEALTTAECTFHATDRDALIAAIPPGQLGAAARDASLADLSAAVTTIASIPGWKVVSETPLSSASTSLVIDTGATEVSVRLFGDVLPPEPRLDARFDGGETAWGVGGQFFAIVSSPLRTHASSVLSQVLASLFVVGDESQATSSGSAPLEYTDGFIPLPDGTQFKIVALAGGQVVCTNETDDISYCFPRLSGRAWPAEIFWHPWSTGMFVYGLLEEPYVVTASTPSAHGVQNLTVVPSQVEGIWICYGVLPSDPDYTVTVSTAAGTVISTETLH